MILDQKSFVNERHPDGIGSEGGTLQGLTSESFNRPKLGVEVTRYLRDAVLAGNFEPGQRLGVASLAEEMGISTMPVREALVALSSEGIVEALPRRGFRVLVINKRDIEDVFQVHGFVAGLLAASAAASMSDSAIDMLRRIQVDIAQIATHQPSSEERSNRIESLNFTFHSTINRSVDAKRLRWFLRAATRFVPRYFYESIPGWTQASVDDHTGIIDAIATRDNARARELMQAHIFRAGSLVVSHLSERGFWKSTTASSSDTIPAAPQDRPRFDFDARRIAAYDE